MFVAKKNGQVIGRGSTLAWAESIASVLGRGAEIYVELDTGLTWLMWEEGRVYPNNMDCAHHVYVVSMLHRRARRRMSATQQCQTQG